MTKNKKILKSTYIFIKNLYFLYSFKLISVFCLKLHKYLFMITSGKPS